MKIGQRVHCILHGGKDGVIAAIHGELDPASCVSLGSIGVAGGNAMVDIIWDNGTTSHVPESLIRRSVQWRLYDEVWSADRVEAARCFLVAEGARKEQEAAEAARVLQEAKEDLLKRYPMLLTADDERLDGKRAIANIRKLLKAAWPKMKFSVRQSQGAVRIAWRDGPTSNQVSEITRQFEAGHFDGMTDCYESRETAWTILFGSAQYVSQVREVTDVAMKRAVDALWANLSNLRDVPKPVDVDERFCWMSRGEVPGLSNTRIEELVQSLVSHYDATTDTYQVPTVAYGRHTFVVSLVREAEQALAA